MNISKKREYQYDNIRFLLIFLVIIGHGLELFSTVAGSLIYTVIYSFHMPAFLYLTGKFSKFDKRKICRHFVFPYLIFQTIYLFFDAFILKDGKVTLQYTKPYWVLWYLMAVVFYYCLIPVIPGKKSRGKGFILLASVAVSLLCGYVSSIGYYLTLSRFFVFAPFFLLGYYSDELKILLSNFLNKKHNRNIYSLICLTVIVAGEIYILFIHELSPKLLYGSYAYAACKASIIDRAVVLLTAFAWINLLEFYAPKVKIPIITVMGQNTMPVFLNHAFIIRLFGKYNVFRFNTILNFLILIILTIMIIAVFGNRYVNKLFKKVF